MDKEWRETMKKEPLGRLVLYVTDHTLRGACLCGKCIDAQDNPQDHQPDGGVDLTFFRVKETNGADADKFKALVLEATPQLLDGAEHSYIEIGATDGGIGQDFALRLIGLGHQLGLWQALTPSTLFGDKLPADTLMKMAGMGLVTLKVGEPCHS